MITLPFVFNLQLALVRDLWEFALRGARRRSVDVSNLDLIGLLCRVPLAMRLGAMRNRNEGGGNRNG